MGDLRIQEVRTSGLFSIDGEDFEVENNIWLIGDDHEVIVIDAAHDAAPIAAAVGGRNVRAIFLTHGHNDHLNAALDLQRTVRGSDGVAPIMLHPNDLMLWSAIYPTATPDVALGHGSQITIAGVNARVLHTPGHSPGGVCLLLAGEVDHVFGGDTLFNGGPGATGRSNSDFPTIIDSIRRELLVLDGNTVVHTGHGAATTIGAEAPHLDEWIARGH